MNSSTRGYRMGARAAAAERTRENIIAATVALFLAADPDAITLEAVAARAGVTLQTVLRRFGSKDALFAAAAELEGAEVARARELDRPGDHAAAIGVLVASYEQIGELNWRLLRFEGRNDALHAVLVGARRAHREWIARAFADVLPARGAARERRLDALFAATDFYLWKLARVDLGRTRAQAQATMLLLVESLVHGFRAGGTP